MPDDGRLVERALHGELEAFEELVRRHERQVLALARRMLRNEADAEDVTQEAFASALDHLEKFRGETSFRSWLMTIVSHAALKVLRKKNSLPTVPLDEESLDGLPRPEFIADWREGPTSLLERKETMRHIQEALDELSENYRLVFLLRDVGELSIRETAGLLGLTENNVKVRLLRARLALREKLTRVFGDSTARIAPHAHGGTEETA
ncbi:MAG: sigma-70 family RNA polymerase sigma factor [Candidatus Wallbacteria bacterium]|nr:sigma-70 family RNA polymerase sigma factor [Candidatus Wallbacteria bacterium]